MKKLFITTMLFITLILTGCGGGDNTLKQYDFWEYFVPSQDANLTYDYYDMDINGTVNNTRINYYTNEYDKINDWYVKQYSGNNLEVIFKKYENNITVTAIYIENNTTNTNNRFLKINDVLALGLIDPDYEGMTLKEHYDSFQLYEGYKTYNDVLQFEKIRNGNGYYAKYLTYYAKDIGFVGGMYKTCFNNENLSNILTESDCLTADYANIYYDVLQD